MTEDLERLLQATEGSPPSDDFVARLRAQIVAETEGVAAPAGRSSIGTVDPAPGSVIETPDDPDNYIHIVVDLEPLDDGKDEMSARRAKTNRRAQLLAVAAAVAVVLGIWALTWGPGDDGLDTELDTVDIPTTSEVPGREAEIGQPITADNTFFYAGTFRIDTLGTPFTFSVEEATGVLLNENDVVMLSDLTSRNTADRTLTFRRTALLPDPATPTALVDRSRGWPAIDLLGFVEAVGGDVTASPPIAVTLGGLDATFTELDFPCVEAPCTGNLFSALEISMFSPGSRYRLWVVDQGAEHPIVVTVAIDDDEGATWFDEADAILATLVFGGTEPNPVRQAPPGELALNVFDGVSLELPEQLIVVESFDGFARLLPNGIEGDVELLTRPLDIGGAEVATTDRLLEILRDQAVEVTELDTIDIDGIAARSFDVVSGSGEKVTLKARNADLVRAEFGWAVPFFGHLWIVEHPERGLLVVSAESWSGPDVVEPLRAWTEDLFVSLRFEER